MRFFSPRHTHSFSYTKKGDGKSRNRRERPLPSPLSLLLSLFCSSRLLYLWRKGLHMSQSASKFSTVPHCLPPHPSLLRRTAPGVFPPFLSSLSSLSLTLTGKEFGRRCGEGAETKKQGLHVVASCSQGCVVEWKKASTASLNIPCCPTLRHRRI